MIYKFRGFVFSLPKLRGFAEENVLRLIEHLQSFQGILWIGTRKEVGFSKAAVEMLGI
jgi:hypothetical protein